MQTNPVITVALTTHQAEAFAQFLKRVGLSDYAALAQGQQEAYAMLSAGEAIRDELAHAGYAPRWTDKRLKKKCRHYLFSSCLRSYWLGYRPVWYLKTVQKALKTTQNSLPAPLQVRWRAPAQLAPCPHVRVRQNVLLEKIPFNPCKPFSANAAKPPPGKNLPLAAFAPMRDACEPAPRLSKMLCFL
jgi:hypothetical protein